MKISFFATLRPIVGGKYIEMPEAIGKTVEQILADLIKRYPPLEAELFTPEGRLQGHVHFFVNGRDIQFYPAGMGYVVEAHDTINIFPAVGGG